MRKLAVIVVLPLALVMLPAENEAHAQLFCGGYRIQASGQAQILAPVSGFCSVSGCNDGGATAPASITGTVILQSGTFLPAAGFGSSFTVSIGATTCENFVPSGTYTVSDKGGGNFELKGKLTLKALSPGTGGCGRMVLIDQPITLLGDSRMRFRDGRRFDPIDVNAMGANSQSMYAEGPEGSLVCTAPIANIVLSGEGELTQYRGDCVQ
ncbi:MAG: hypothetical protein ACRERC_00540 [Candidatus Binatia bacterium]